MKRALLNLASLLTLGGILWAAYLQLDGAPLPAEAKQLEALYATALPDLDGRIQSLQQWRGKVLVVNYWATWCIPCREEMPMLSKLQDHFAPLGVVFVGIAVDEADKVREFARATRVSYPMLIGGGDAIKPTLGFGNTPLALPFTIVLGRDGKVYEAKLGRLQEDALSHLLDGLTQDR